VNIKPHFFTAIPSNPTTIEKASFAHNEAQYLVSYVQLFFEGTGTILLTCLQLPMAVKSSSRLMMSGVSAFSWTSTPILLHLVEQALLGLT
jgi:hypothetical protein